MSTATDAALSPPRAAGEALAEVSIKTAPEHFHVVEIPAAEPAGEGAHLWLELERTGMNTAFVAGRLAQAAGVAPRDVGYAGLKDRHAVTRQWFSVPATSELCCGDGTARLAARLARQGVRCIAGGRHPRKLRRGALAGNRFRIRVQGVRADAPGLAARVEALGAQGAPNYFGPQRFGHGGANLEQARTLFAGSRPAPDRHRRGLYLSAARALLFNRVLAARVAGGSWNRLLAGDTVMLDGSASYFHAEVDDGTLARRLEDLDVHPGGPLWGAGESPARDAALAVECEALAGCEDLMRGLAAAGLEQARRALRVAVRELAVAPADGNACWLSFRLPPGAYATVVLAELFALRDAAAPAHAGPP